LAALLSVNRGQLSKRLLSLIIIMSLLRSPSSRKNLTKEEIDDNPKARILKAALSLFAQKGYAKTTTKELANRAKVAEGTIFRHFNHKKDILMEVATAGWVEILTDLLTELSEMDSYKAIGTMMRKRMFHLQENQNLFRVCFLEAQFHPELRDRIQSEVISKMTDVAEAFLITAINRGVYRQINPKIIAQVFLGMFLIAGFSNKTIVEANASPQDLQEMAEGIADIFLNGVLVKE
jgi:AcrR family transcriptional regulator